MKTLWNRLVCFLLNRHTEEYMKAHGGKIHNFYGVNGSGKMCTCPKCGKYLLFKIKGES